MVVQLSITVANVGILVPLGYSRIEIWASTDQGNIYEEVTASTAQSAILTSSAASTTFNMGGKLLTLSINGGANVSIPFAATPAQWTPLQVVSRINEVVPGLAFLYETNKVKLASPTTGRVSSLRIIYNDADDLGLPANTKSYGKDARPVLTLGQLIYTYNDVAGHSDYRYKWRFSANGSNPISEFSERVLGSAAPISGVPLSVGTATFVGLDGKAQKRRIIVVSDRPPAVIAGSAVGNELPVIVDSDDLGFLQVPLVQGAVVRVAIEGTAYVREFTVPSTASFDLLQVMASAPDPFTIQTTAPFLIRRSI